MKDFLLTPLGRELLEKAKNSDTGNFVSDKVSSYQNWIDQLDTDQYNDFIKAGMSPEQALMIKDIAMMSPAMGTTRAVKQLGPTVGKTMNELASKIKDSSPHAEHLTNLQKIREVVKNNPKMLDEGAFKRVYDSNDKVVKVAGADHDLGYLKSEILPESIQEQLTFNKLKELAPTTKTYKTSNKFYQVQDKVTPFEKTTNNAGDWQDQEDILKVLTKNKGLGASDLSPINHGVDKNNMPKIMDVGAFDKIKNIDYQDVEDLNSTYRKLPSENVDYINELLKLRGK